MELSHQLKLKLLTISLLQFIVSHRGAVSGSKRNLHCVNDYLTTINCSLSGWDPDRNGSYTLNLTETTDETKYGCELQEIDRIYFCSIRIHKLTPGVPDTFDALDSYSITLCHSASQRCEELIDDYQVSENIKPNAPCCLTLSHNSSHHLFTWRSTYEDYSLEITLPEQLIYQLELYQPGDSQNVTPQKMTAYRTNLSIASKNMAQGTKYAARVRSSPCQANCGGEWSAWSSEVHWRTVWTQDDTSTKPGLVSMYGLAKVFVPVCILAPFVLLCSVYFKMSKKNAFIPTPAPYFHSLYSDCQGDFKSWVVAHEKTAGMLQAEEIIKFDTVVRCPEVPEEVHCTTNEHPFSSGYTNVINPSCDECFLGFPYAVSTVVPPPVGSVAELNFSSDLGSRGKEAPWYYCMTGDAPMYCNKYCTLSAFYHSHADTAENIGKVSEIQA